MQTDPRTLIWVGPTNCAEFREAYQVCRDQVGQIAVRGHLYDLQQRPAGYVGCVLVARLDRRPAPTALLDRLRSHYQDAQWLALTGPLCDGESRTGAPWPGIPHLRFSRWQEHLPSWLAACGFRTREAPVSRSVVVVCDRFDTAAPLLERYAAQGQSASWRKRFLPSIDQHIDHVIWDDSVAPPTTVTGWQSRLQGTAKTTRHTWSVLQPQAHEIREARLGGIDRVLSKPWSMLGL